MHGVEVEGLARTAIGSRVVALVAAAVPTTAGAAAEAAVVDGDGGAAVRGAASLPKVHGSGGCASAAEAEEAGRSIGAVAAAAASGLLGIRQGTDADQDADVGRSDVGVAVRARHGLLLRLALALFVNTLCSAARRRNG